MSFRLKYTILLLLSSLSLSLAQRDTISRDTTPIVDSLNMVNSLEKVQRVQISKDSLEDIVEYSADGHEEMDIKNKIVHLYNNAVVKYQNIEVQGEYIQFDFENNIATAKATFDSSGILLSKANFKEGDNHFQYDYLKYNFKTKKGFVKQGVTTEGDLFIHGGTTKFISKIDSLSDDVLYNKDAIVTSCNLNHPHFGIHTKKLKVIPKKIGVIGPSQLEILDIPTPLWLPFGFFPISVGKSSGLILPRNYDLDKRFGLGLKGIGYYIPINEYIDAKITGSIYLRGTWSLTANSKYKKNYRYSGAFNLTRSSHNLEDLEGAGYIRNISYQFKWIHKQDPKAHPYQNFNSSVDLQTSGFNVLNNVSAFQRQRDVITSTIGYSYQFGTSPFSLSVGASATQSLNLHTMEIVLPDAKFTMKAIKPFKRKKFSSKERFYEKIRLNYNSQFKSHLSSTDSTFYNWEEIKNANTGVKHSASANANFKFLKYFSFNPSVNYDEVWFFTQNEDFRLDTLVLDTISNNIDATGQTVVVVDSTFGIIQNRVNRDFLSYRQVDTRAGISTKLFGTRNWSKGPLRGIRHIITPSVSINYRPGTISKYERTIDIDYRANIYNPYNYSIIPNGVFNARPTEEQFNISMDVTNDIEIKWKNKRDSIAQKVRLTNFSYGIRYNTLTEELSDFTLRGSSNFFHNKSSISYNLILSPFKFKDGVATEEYVWQDEKRLPIIPVFNIESTWRITFYELRNMIFGVKKSTSTNSSKKKEVIHVNSAIYNLFDNFGLNYKLNWGFRNNGSDSESKITKNSISFQGNIDLTEKWQINIGSVGYDFIRKGLTYPDVGFSRDLHCWRMTFSWQPAASQFGGAYQFFIGVNSNSLEFIKYNYNQGFGGF